MNIEQSIEILKEYINYMPLGARVISFRKGQFIDCQIAVKTLLTAYEKEKEKNKTTKQMNENLIEALKESISKDKIKAGIEVAREKYNDLHTKHLRDCGIAEQRELAKIEFGESLLKEE